MSRVSVGHMFSHGEDSCDRQQGRGAIPGILSKRPEWLASLSYQGHRPTASSWCLFVQSLYRFLRSGMSVFAADLNSRFLVKHVQWSSCLAPSLL